MRKKSTWTDETTGRTVRRCSRCGDVKDLETEFALRSPNHPYPSMRHEYVCIPCHRLVSAEKYARRVADPVRKAALNEYWRRKAAERYRENPAAKRAADRLYRERVNADPERRQRFLETRRMAHALRKEREFGKPLRLVDLGVGEIQHGGPTLPGLPLAAAVERMVRRAVMAENGPGPVEDRERSGWGDETCRQLGISPRAFFRWRRGLNVELGPADAVLTRSGLNWWDVWNEDTVRRPVLTVVVAKRSRKKKTGRLYWETTHRLPYGDQGPDFEVLARVAAVFGDVFEEAVA
jgi:hypothetical protein